MLLQSEVLEKRVQVLGLSPRYELKQNFTSSLILNLSESLLVKQPWQIQRSRNAQRRLSSHLRLMGSPNIGR